MELKIAENIYLKISEGEFNFSDVIKDLKNNPDVFISTFNLSLKKETELINKLKEVNADVTVISNIPEHNNKNSLNKVLKNKARDQIELYTNAFSDTYNVSHIINLALHGKMFITDEIGYIGSANYSDYSKKSIEIGIIIKDESVLYEIKKNVIPYLINHEKSITKVKFLQYWKQYHIDKLDEINILELVIRDFFNSVVMEYDYEYSIEDIEYFKFRHNLLYELLNEMLYEELYTFHEENRYINIPETTYEMQGYNPEYDCICILENGLSIYKKYPEDYGGWIDDNCNKILKQIEMIKEGLKITIETLNKINQKTEELKN